MRAWVDAAERVVVLTDAGISADPGNAEFGGVTLPAMKLSTGELARTVAPHLLAFAFPCYALFFLVTGPHQGWSTLLYVMPLLVHATADLFSPPLRRQPHPEVPSWPFDGILYVLAAVQLANIALLGRMFTSQSFWSLDTLVATVVVGANTGYSAIVVAHELIHRRAWGEQQLGRLLMCTAMYEHFYTEHLRGHHVRVGTEADPATARFGESFARFFFRTVPGQFRSAWRLEAKRLGVENLKPWNPRALHSRVVHGLAAECLLALGVLLVFGGAALAAFLLQAIFAFRSLEVVNYFEHWGLVRSGPRVRAVDSWDTDSWVTYYSLTGLSRHADHHNFGSRSYEQLRVREESPRLPGGYLSIFPLILARNKKFQRLMTVELERCKLGPFAPGARAACNHPVSSQEAPSPCPSFAACGCGDSVGGFDERAPSRPIEYRSRVSNNQHQLGRAPKTTQARIRDA